LVELARIKGRDAAVTVLAMFGAKKLPDVAPRDYRRIVDACEAAR